jgi:hypothetical protein
MTHLASAETAATSRLPAETVSVEHAAQRLGISRSRAYISARDDGAIVPGVPVLRCGRKMLVPVRALDRVLFTDSTATDGTTQPIAG